MINMITDRISGAAIYGYTDLNRVESAVKEIAQAFPTLGIDLDLVTKTDWGLPGDYSASEWVVESHINRYLWNVREIKRLFPSSVSIPETMNNLTWNGANNIEKALEIAMTRIESIKISYRYSGELIAGEELI